MKKKAKLFTTLASLCLAVALLVFGVYAAVSASFTVHSKVYFKATKDVYLTFAGASVYTTSTLNVNTAEKAAVANTWSNQPVATYTPANASNWTTIYADNSPKSNPGVGELTILEENNGNGYAFRKETTQGVDGAESTTPAIYGYKVVLTFDIEHADQEYLVTMEGDATVEAQYNVNVWMEDPVKTTNTAPTKDVLTVTYYVVLTDVDSDVGTMSEPVDPEEQAVLEAVDLDLTFTFARNEAAEH